MLSAGVCAGVEHIMLSQCYGGACLSLGLEEQAGRGDLWILLWVWGGSEGHLSDLVEVAFVEVAEGYFEDIVAIAVAVGVDHIAVAAYMMVA